MASTDQKTAPLGGSASEVSALLHSLADPVRLAIVNQLDTSGELACGQLEIPVSKSTCSHHLKNLAAAGVITEREEGTRKYLRLQRAELDGRYPGLLDSVLRATRDG
jgi:DNA-binding transcriptional ArsR family regulator